MDPIKEWVRQRDTMVVAFGEHFAATTVGKHGGIKVLPYTPLNAAKDLYTYWIRVANNALEQGREKGWLDTAIDISDALVFPWGEKKPTNMELLWFETMQKFYSVFKRAELGGIISHPDKVDVDCFYWADCVNFWVACRNCAFLAGMASVSVKGHELTSQFGSDVKSNLKLVAEKTGETLGVIARTAGEMVGSAAGGFIEGAGVDDLVLLGAGLGALWLVT